jgi:predicted transcriptional regulator
VKFPTNTAELKAEYRTAPDEIVGEEESLGTVLDRLDDEYDDELTARKAILEELGEAEHADPDEQYEKEAAEVQRELEGVVDAVDEEDDSDVGY